MQPTPSPPYRTPKLFLLRHGPTEWSTSGRYTSRTDLSLLPEGETQVRASAQLLFGDGKLINPRRLSLVILSPRRRAARTWEIFTGRGGPQLNGHADQLAAREKEVNLEVTEDVREWDYGGYEGLLTKEIRERWKDSRLAQGIEDEREWDIWRDGCADAGGESPTDVTERVDRVIRRVIMLQRLAIDAQYCCDIVIVAHGHILRAMVKRWIGAALGDQRLEGLMFEAGGVAVLSYQHDDVEQRAVVVGTAVA